MQDYIKDLHIARLCAGYLIFEQDDIVLSIINPDKNINYNAHNVYHKVLEECQLSGTLSSVDIIDWMIEQNLWNKDKDIRIKELRDSIPNMKMEVFKNWIKTGTVNILKKNIRKAEQEISELLVEKNAYYSITSEGIANYNKWIYLTEQCVKLNGLSYNFIDISVECLLNHWHSNILSDIELRQLAKQDAWLSIWYSSNKNPFIGYLSDEQRQLIMWAKMYDNIKESTDCPSDEVIDDDDAIDGWILINRRKSEKDRTTKMVESTITNKNNHSEVFIPVESLTEAKHIFELNNPQGAMTIQSRMKQIKDSSGEVRQGQFSDIKLQRQLTANNMEANNLRGK